MDGKKNNKQTDPITNEEEVKESNDERIDQDVPGFPHPPSRPEDLKRKQEKDKKEGDEA